MIEICAIGGYSEVGKNCTAIKIDNEVIILDMGIHLPKIIDFEEEGGDRSQLTREHLIRLGAIPNDTKIESWKPLVKAIAIGHCHLDHSAGIPYLAPQYPQAPILGTPFTIEVLRQMLRDDKFDLKNPLKSINPNSIIKVSDTLSLEFINMTHSTPQTAMIAIHSKYGIIIYANDFKFDNSPVVGKKANIERLKQLGNENIIALIVDSLYANAEQKTPSEKVAREMLKDVMLGTESSNNLIIATTFASHIARLKSIIDFGKQLNRKIVFLGRSLHKYTKSAERMGIVNFSKDVEILPYARQIRHKLREIEKEGREKYLIIATGNQGEPKSVLVKMTKNILPFDFLPEDHIIFSCRVIPDPKNIKNREELEKRLRKYRTRIFTSIHVSGHCSREDLRDLINILKPKHLIPAHGGKDKQLPFSELAQELGYKVGENIHLMDDGKKIELK